MPTTSSAASSRYLDGTEWRKVELEKSALDPREWIGQLANPLTSDGSYDIALLDSGANVGTSRFKGTGYVAQVGSLPPTATVIARTEPPAPEAPVTVVDDEWTADPVEVNLVGQPEATTGWDVKVEQLTSSSPETFTPIDAGVDGTTVNLSSDGVFRVTYTRGDDAVLIRTIRIDVIAPTVTFADVQVVFPGEPVQPASPVCTDVPAPGAVESSGLAGDCVITSALGEATTAIATDAVGNTSEPRTQTLVTVSGDGYWVTASGSTAAPRRPW